MTLDQIQGKIGSFSLLNTNFPGVFPTSCIGVSLLEQNCTVFLDQYIYIMGRGSKALPPGIYEKRRIALLLPESACAGLPTDKLLCDWAVYEDGVSEEQLLQALAAILAEEQQIISFKLEITSLFLKDADIPSLLSCASRALNNPICVLDPSHQLLYQSGLSEALSARDPVVKDLMAERSVSPPLYTRYAFTALHSELLQAIEPFHESKDGLLPRIYFRLMDRRSYLGHVELVGANVPFRPSDRECVKLLSEILVMKLRGSLPSADGAHHENLLYGLLDGSIGAPEQLEPYPGSSALLDREFCLLLLEPDQSAGPMEDISGNYLLMARKHMNRWFPAIQYVCLFNQKIVALVESSYIPRVSEQLPQFLSTYRLYGAATNLVSGIFSLHIYYRQGLELLHLSRGKWAESDSRFFSFSEQYCALLLEPVPDRCQASEYILPQWLRLCRYDEAHRTCYVQTLYTHLITRGIVQTAKKLHIHKNTLIYRLEKIQEIAHCDLEDEEERHRLYLSFLLLRRISGKDASDDSFPNLNGAP